MEKRKQELQEYLRDILASAELLHSNTILSFLEVPDSVRPMLARTPSSNLMYPGVDLKDMNEEAKARLLSSKADYQHKTYEERRVLELITLLKHHPNKVWRACTPEQFLCTRRCYHIHMLLHTRTHVIRLLLSNHSKSTSSRLDQVCVS